MDETIEAQIGRLDTLLAESEKQAKALLGRIQGARKRTNDGELAPLAGVFEPMNQLVQQFAGSIQAASEALTYDPGTTLADGTYLAELREAASAQNLVLTERDGRVTAFPLLLKFEPKSAAIRVGRKLERRLRPSLLVKLLRRAQAASRFDGPRFLAQLFGAYGYLAPLAQPGWKPGQEGWGPVVPLGDVHALLTVLPVAAADYTREEFACDLLRLDRMPDTRTASGHGFSLPASTGSKGRNRLTVFDETGAEHVFVGIRFAHDPAADA